MKSFLNQLLNVFLGVKFRYGKIISVGKETRFLRSFSISGKGEKLIIGENSLVGCQVVFEGENAKVEIGNNVYFGSSRIICRDNITFGNNILVSWGVTFYDHNSHSLREADRRKDIAQALQDFNSNGNFLMNKDWTTVETKGIIIQDDAWIGMEALILKGVTIGKGAIVGARSVVTKDVLPYTVVAGNPAKEVKKLDSFYSN